MSDVFKIKQGDTAMSLALTLICPTGLPEDLTTAVGVDFHMKNEAGVVVINAPAVIVDALTGKVRYDWTAQDLAVVGSFEGEFEVDWSNGQYSSYPNTTNIKIKIVPEIA